MARQTYNKRSPDCQNTFIKFDCQNAFIKLDCQNTFIKLDCQNTFIKLDCQNTSITNLLSKNGSQTQRLTHLEETNSLWLEQHAISAKKMFRRDPSLEVQTKAMSDREQFERTALGMERKLNLRK